MKPRLKYLDGDWVISTTPEQVKCWMRRHGISVVGWAKEHGFSRYTVNDLLRGKQVGNRGKSHEAAIALGLKLDPKWVRP